MEAAAHGSQLMGYGCTGRRGGERAPLAALGPPYLPTHASVAGPPPPLTEAGQDDRHQLALVIRALGDLQQGSDARSGQVRSDQANIFFLLHLHPSPPPQGR